MNVAVAGTTTKAPLELLDFVKSLEREMGRTATYRWGPRMIDVDILLYGDQTVNLPALTIPHPEMLNRAFVLRPLCELAHDVLLPNGRAICEEEWLSTTSDQIVRRMGSLSVESR